MEELSEEMTLAATYAPASPTAPPPSPLADRAIKSEPIVEEGFDWRRTSVIDVLFGGPPRTREPSTLTPTIKQEHLTPPARTSMDDAFDEKDRAINQVRPSREGYMQMKYSRPQHKPGLRSPPAHSTFGQPNPNSSSQVVLLYFYLL